MSPVSNAIPSASRAGRPGAVALGALLFLAVVAVYLRTLSHGFIWDDDLHVTINPRIVGPQGLKEIWTTAAANYFPLVLTNFWLQHALWGLAPFGYHAVTIACHALCAVLLWRVLVELRVPGAWLGAALWALHPVQVESVAWISELKNTQSGIFFLLSILYYVRWLDREETGASGRAAYALALICGLLAILSKPSTVMLPVALALCAWWRRGSLRVRDLVALAPLFALSALASGWAIWEQRIHSGASGAEWNQSLLERTAIAGKIIWFYLGKLLWPHPLSFIYRRWDPAVTALALLPFVMAVACFGLLWWRRRRWRPAFVAAVFFGALLFPVLGFFNVFFFRYSFVGDHFQYLASMGPLALLGAGLTLLPRRVLAVAAAALLFACGGLSWRQSAIYHSSTTLWQATVEANPTAVMAWINLGDSLSLEQRYPESIAAYREALRRRPEDADALNDLGCLLTLTGDVTGAIRELEHAIAVRPDLSAAHNNLGNAFHAAGRSADAIAQYREAIRLKPRYGEALGNLGAELAGAGRPGEAIPHLEAALQVMPNHQKTRDDLGRALQAQGAVLAAGGDWRGAAAHFERAVAQLPDSKAAHAGLAVALVNSDRLEAAVPAFQAALRLDPNSAELHDNFGQVLNALGRKREALAQMDEAARLRRR
jgi:tetratricopeptide (TPR) repeat protein